MRTFHLSGATLINRYDFAKQIAENFNLDSNLIGPTTSAEFSWTAKRPRDSSLDTAKAQASTEKQAPTNQPSNRKNETGTNPKSRIEQTPDRTKIIIVFDGASVQGEIKLSSENKEYDCLLLHRQTPSMTTQNTWRKATATNPPCRNNCTWKYPEP